MRKAFVAVFLVVAGCVSMQSSPGGDGETRILDNVSSRLVGANGTWEAALDRTGAFGGLLADAGATGSAASLWDWNLQTGSSVTGSPAIYGSFTTAAATDALYFGVSGSGTGVGITSATPNVANYNSAMANANFFKLTNLYQTTPTVDWYATVAGGLVGTSPIFSKDGTKIYVVGGTGSVYCFPSTVTGQTAPYAMPSTSYCSGWTARSVSPGGTITVANSSPWLDRSNNAIYFGATNGTLYKVNASTGATVWTKALGAAIHSSPIVVSKAIYVGDDSGYFHRLIDPGTTAPTTDSTVRLCSTCKSTSAIYSGASLDVSQAKVYISAEGKVYEFPHDATGATAWAQTSTSPKDLNTTAGSIMYSSPYLDWSNGFLYVGYANQIFKIAYPFVGNGTSGYYSASLAGSGADNSYPRSSPLSYSNIVYIGNGAGNTEEYGCSTSGLSPSLKATTQSYGTSVDSTPLADYASGNVNFGYTSATGGGLVQIAQGGTWGCPTGKISCSSAGCGGACAECCSNSNCATGYNCNNFKCIQNCQNPPSSTCGTNSGNGNFSLTLTCPGSTETIVGVEYAYFGNPSGSCGSGYTAGSCNDSNAASKVLTTCKGSHSCSLSANSFSSGCSGTQRLAVKVACSAAAGLICSTNNTTSTSCTNGVCSATCASGYADCNSDVATDGCETGTTTNTSNCGGCGNVCSSNNLPTPTCTGGVCGGTCATGYADCNNNKLTDGCESAISCSSCCGVACTTGQSCINGTCQNPSTSFTSCVDHIANNSTATLSCPSGYTIQNVSFAGYGQPSGTCSNASALADASCDAANVPSKIRGLCQNQNTCSFTVTSSLFSQNMSCTGSIWFSANVTCASSAVTYCP